MKLQFVVFLSFFFLLLAAQQEEGFVRFYYPGGQVSSEGIMKNGKPDGYWKSYYPNGVLKSEGKRTNFLLDSTWIFYTETGDTLEKINYLNGKKSGFYYKYQVIQPKNDVRKNVVILKELYINDVREGPSYVYYPDGKLKSVTRYSNGKPEESFEYDEKGTLITIFSYKNGILRNVEKINRYDAAGKKTGVWREYYPDGKLKSEATYKNGVLYGLKKEYDNTGKLISSVNYIEGNIDIHYNDENDSIEIVETTYENGTVKTSGAYKKGIPIGVHKIYDEKGNLYKAVIYDKTGKVMAEGGMNSQARRDGRWVEYYETGRKKNEGSYLNGRRTGEWVYFFPSGEKEQKGFYKDDKYDGMWEWYDQKGNLVRREYFSEGKEHGMYLELSVSGDTIASGQYAEGIKHGFWTEKEGKITFMGEYINGEKNGLWKGYFDKNKIYFTGNFEHGNPEGKHVFYYESVSIREVQYYSGGLKVGNWVKYNEEGILICVITYRNNEEYMVNGFKVEKIGK